MTGTVKRFDLEGGFFGILAEDGAQLYPTNLPTEFQRDGLRIRFDFEKAAVFTIHQWGTPVSVTNVEKAQ